MITNITPEINDIIAKNLPAQVGDVLQKRLAEASTLEAEVDRQKQSINYLTKQIEQANALISDYRKKEEKYQTLEQLEKSLKAAETQLTVERLSYQLQTEKEKSAFTQEVALGLVRNTVFRNRVWGTAQTPVTDTYGNRMMESTENDSNKETVAE